MLVTSTDLPATSPAIPDIVARLQGIIESAQTPEQTRLRVFLDDVFVYAEQDATQAFESLAVVLNILLEHIDDRGLGYALVEVMPGVLARIFNGDTELLLDIALDASGNEFMRSIALGAITILAYERRIDMSVAERAMAALPRTAPSLDQARLWGTWMGAIAALGLTELAPMVERTMLLSGLPEMIDALDNFKRSLLKSQQRPAIQFTSKRGYFPVFTTAAEARTRFQNVLAAQAAIRRTVAIESGEFVDPFEPATNAYRNIGRNDPCPCGSGKKHKKCCLN
jgi:uncharacterized protein